MTFRDIPELARDTISIFLLCATSVFVAFLFFAITEGIIRP